MQIFLFSKVLALCCLLLRMVCSKRSVARSVQLDITYACGIAVPVPVERERILLKLTALEL